METIVPDLVEFAFHARKVNDFCSLKNDEFPSINKMLVVIEDDDPAQWEENYCHALNALMHMNSFVFGNARADHRKIFLASEVNLMTTYITVQTDRYPETKISIYGLIDCFLSVAIPKIRSKFPHFVF